MVETSVPPCVRASRPAPGARVWGYALLGVAVVLALVNVAVGASAGTAVSGAGLAAVVAGLMGALLVEVPPTAGRGHGGAAGTGAGAGEGVAS